MPQPSLTAIETLNKYVRCRWPIHVFALESITQEQNVTQILNRRRELQLANPPLIELTDLYASVRRTSFGVSSRVLCRTISEG
jgi:hypothetical protein